MAHNKKSMAWRKLPFWDRVQKQVEILPNGCHVWTGLKVGNGYGIAHDDRHHRLIHRAVWERANGTIPVGMFVLHKCDNPPCCNIEHLFLGTILDNNRDRERKGRGNKVKGKNHARPMAKLTEENVADIRAEFAKGYRCGIGNELAKKYGVSIATISSIKHRNHWRHIGS